MKNSRFLHITGFVLLGLVATILCIRQVGEPDVWWQIRTGQYIIANSEVPKVDVFSYTYAGEEWINVKWLTEVIMALISDSLSPEFLPLFQWLVILCILILLFKSIRNFQQALNQPKEVLTPGILLSFLVFLIGMAYRLNTRPEIISYLFTAFFLYQFIRFQNKKDNFIFLLIPAQMLWANMHEAYGVGIVMLVIFTGSAWIRYYFASTPSKNELKKLSAKLSLAAILAILSCGIHPSGIQMILHPFEIFGQLQSNKFTTELLSYKNSEFWQLPAFIMLFFLVMAGLFIARSQRGKLWKSFGLGFLILFLAFLYLSFQAYRNIPFFLIIATPFAAIFMNRIIPDQKIPRIAIITILAASYLCIGSGKFYDWFFPREKYGLRVDPARNPIGAARFIEQHEIEGNGFVDYFNSSFFLWYLAPDFKSYIDLRDLDIFEAMFIQNVMRANVNPQMPTRQGLGIWELMDQTDNFSYIVMINRQEFRNFHQYIRKHQNWQLVYFDLNNTVYLKRNEFNMAVIHKLKKDPLEAYFSPYQSLDTPKPAIFISQLFWPGYRETDYQKSDYSQEMQNLRQLLQ